MIAACIIATGAQAQTYNATGSERQAASNDMGMYQLTLQAFRQSEYYLRSTGAQAQHVRWSFNKVILVQGLATLVSPSGQIITYTPNNVKWYELSSSGRFLMVGGESASAFNGNGMYSVSK